MAHIGRVVFLCSVFSVIYAQVDYQPEQVHLSYGDDPTQMVVTWVTQSALNTSVVEYGQNGLDMVAVGPNATKFVDGGSLKRTIYIHRVKLTDLVPGQTYRYHCGSDKGWSELFVFTAMKSGSNWSPRFAIFGDLGNENAQSLTRLQEETQKGFYDAILHVGDFAYNMFEENGRTGDAFMKQIEPVAAYVPYMTCVGNHEWSYNFSHYKNRFTMPKAGGDGQNLWYSFNIGPAHIIGFSTEVYFYVEYGWAPIYYQYKWLENDLKEANRPENRAKRPWIITMGHRPMYCSNTDRDDCTRHESIVRTGLPFIHSYGLEDLFYKYGVDLELWAHEHDYERLWPIYNRVVCNGSYDKPFTNPGAPVHIITGSGGCRERHDPFMKQPPEWSSFRSLDYGYTRMEVINATHLYMEQVSDDKHGEIVDQVMVVKDNHGPYKCHLKGKQKNMKTGNKFGN